MKRWALGTYSFLIAVAFVPGIVGAATSPRWFFVAWSLVFLHPFCLPFIAYCFLMLEFDQACHWAFACGALSLGARYGRIDERTGASPLLEAIVPAFAAGTAVSSAVAILQLVGWETTLPSAGPPAGLFVQKNVMGETCLLAVAALAMGLVHGRQDGQQGFSKLGASRWLLIAAQLPGVFISHSRAAWLATAATVFVILRPWARLWLLLACCGLFALMWWNDYNVGLSSLFQRLVIWNDAIRHVDWLGNGSYDFSTVQHREPHLHHDWLQFIYELGLAGLVPVALVFRAGLNGALPFVVALLVLGSFGFPLHSPAGLWLSAVIVGVYLRYHVDDGRVLPRARHRVEKLRRSGQGPQPVSVSQVSGSGTGSNGVHKGHRAGGA